MRLQWRCAVVCSVLCAVCGLGVQQYSTHEKNARSMRCAGVIPSSACQKTSANAASLDPPPPPAAGPAAPAAAAAAFALSALRTSAERRSSNFTAPVVHRASARASNGQIRQRGKSNRHPKNMGLFTLETGRYRDAMGRQADGKTSWGSGRWVGWVRVRVGWVGLVWRNKVLTSPVVHRERC